MATCPAGHISASTLFCAVCGTRITQLTETAPELHALELLGDEPCPDCGTTRAGRFCENCGYDFATSVRAARLGNKDRSTPATDPPSWLVVVAADPAYYRSMADRGMLDPDLVIFPHNAPQRRIRLTGQRVHIGRGSASRGNAPEIDLGQPPADPAVSHVHAVLTTHGDNAWAVLDPGSINGTTINGTDDPIQRNMEVPLHDGDRIYVGAWTVITLQKE